MLRAFFFTCTALLIWVATDTYSAEGNHVADKAANSSASDHRVLVSMPDRARQLMRLEMLDHLSTLNEIIGYLAVDNLQALADVAEQKLGRSSMGKHRGTGMGPGRFMPVEMRMLAHGMHDAASELSRVASQGNRSQTYSALQKVTSLCVACHSGFRTR